MSREPQAGVRSRSVRLVEPAHRQSHPFGPVRLLGGMRHIRAAPGPKCQSTCGGYRATTSCPSPCVYCALEPLRGKDHACPLAKDR